MSPCFDIKVQRTEGDSSVFLLLKTGQICHFSTLICKNFPGEHAPGPPRVARPLGEQGVNGHHCFGNPFSPHPATPLSKGPFFNINFLFRTPPASLSSKTSTVFLKALRLKSVCLYMGPQPRPMRALVNSIRIFAKIDAGRIVKLRKWACHQLQETRPGTGSRSAGAREVEVGPSIAERTEPCLLLGAMLGVLVVATCANNEIDREPGPDWNLGAANLCLAVAAASYELSPTLMGRARSLYSYMS